MTNHQLGRLESVELRAIWSREASDFTPWLAREENLALLADKIGLDLELVTIESAVGPFRADIVCKDTVSGEMVLIENQIETTDHSHLGQLLTYAAGLDAVTIVWIARRFSDEHRAALDWLNEVTSENIAFFGLEIELWRIGNSPVAPKFNVISQPNGWVKRVAAERISGGQELSGTTQLQLEYWQEFQRRVSETSRVIKARKALPQHWSDFALGHSEFYLQAAMKSRENQISVALGLVGPNKAQHYRQLFLQKDEIERAVGFSLNWYELPGKKSSYISLYRQESPLKDRQTWPAQHEWLLLKLESFHRTFAQRVKTISAMDDAADRSLIAPNP